MNKGAQADPQLHETRLQEPQSEGWTQANTSRKFSIHILLLGPRKSGKTAFVDSALGASTSRQGPSPTNYQPTKDFYISPPCWFYDWKFKFIDSPGFDDPTDLKEKLLKLVEFFSPTQDGSLPTRLAGIFYFHPVDQDSADPSLYKKLQMIKAVVGDRYLERITILVKPQAGDANRNTDPTHAILSPGSPFKSFYCETPEPKVRIYELDRQSIAQLVRPYTSLWPSRFFIQDRVIKYRQGKSSRIWTVDAVSQFLQDELDKDTNHHIGNHVATTSALQNGGDTRNTYDGKPSTQALAQPEDNKEDIEFSTTRSRQGNENPPVTEQEKSPGLGFTQGNSHNQDVPIAVPLPPEVQELRTSINLEDQLAQQPEENAPVDKFNKIESIYKAQIKELRDRLGETETEYASLRAQLQVHDKIEHSHIVQTFKDINRLTEELGQSVAEHIVDTFTRDLTPIQDIEDSKFQKLCTLFGTREGQPSLIRSSVGTFPEVEDFLFYAMRATICQQIYRHLLEPFHPSLSEEGFEIQNAFIKQVYRQIAQQETQAVVGRWRRDTFNAISKVSGPQMSGYERKICQIITDSMTAVIRNFVSPSSGEFFTEEHMSILSRLISAADAWNQLVKGAVVFHGDFQAAYYPYCTDFQAGHMSEAEGKSNHEGGPSVSLATIGLGLLRYNAVGGGQEPKKTVIWRASIASERIVFAIQ